MDTNSKDDLAKLVTKRLALSRDFTKPYFDTFIDNYKHYFLRTIDDIQSQDEEAYPFYSNIQIPVSFQIVETLLPRMFSTMGRFTIKTDTLDDDGFEQKVENLVRYQMNHPYLIDDPIYVRLATSQKETFITGNAWGMVPWMLKEATVDEWQPYSPELGINEPSWEALKIMKQYDVRPRWKLVKVKKRLIDAPVYEHPSIFHVFPDPKAKRVSQMNYAVIEKFQTKDEIMEMINNAKGRFQNLDKLKDMKPLKEMQENAGGSGGDNNYDNDLADIFGSTDYTNKDDSKGQGQHKVLYMLEAEKMTIVVDDQITIATTDNPNGDGKLGLFLSKDIPVPNQLYAWGEIDPIKRLEDSMSDQFNMRNDAVLYDLLRMYMVNSNSLVDGEQFIPEPGGIVNVKDMNAIQPIDVGSTPASAYREYQEWDKIIQGTSGVTDYTTGKNEASMNKTMGGVELLQAAANARFGFKLQLFELLTLKAMGTMYVQRNIRYFDNPQVVEDSQGQKTVVTPDELRMLRGDVNFMVDSGSTAFNNAAKEYEKWQGVSALIAKNQPPFDNLSQESKDKIATRQLNSMQVSDAEDLIQRDANAVMANSDQLLAQKGIQNEQNTPALPQNIGA